MMGLGFGLVAMLVAIGVMSVAGYVIAVAATGPDLSELKPVDKGESSVIFAADGSRLGYVQSDEIRTPVDWSEMPKHVRRAAVAIEDERFYEHEGVDYSAIVRAGVKNIESGKNVQGGSTITQQLVRALYIKDPQRNFTRKIREAKLASELEKKRSKRWILKNYLNDVPFGTVDGRTAIGIEAAAETFFAKHAKDLTLAEGALLAGLPQAPSQYNPFRDPAAALGRRNEVLRKMADNRFITESEAASAARERLDLRKGTRYTSRREPYFFDYVQEKLIEAYGVGVYRRGGLKVYTTIDPELQEAGRKAIAGQLYLPEDPSSAIVSVDPATGYIRAMASSGTYGERNFNLAAQGRRQPGSAFKTFVLATAVRKGIDPDSKSYTSQPLSLNLEGFGPWQVETYDKSYGGTMNLTRATLKSDNTIYAQLILDVGPKEVKKTAEMMGITTKLDGFPAEGLGGLRLGVSPLEMANAYATLASGGIRNEPKAIRRVEFPGGKSDDLGEPERKRVFPDGVAYEVTKVLEQNIQSGTGTKASVGCPAAGKTGTTDNFNDAWFVGYTPKLATSVWVGYPNALTEMSSVHGISVAGGTFPAGIWHDYMLTAKDDFCDGFAEPEQAADFSSPDTQEPAVESQDSGDSSADEGADDGYIPPANEDGSTGTDPGYDPRLYEDPSAAPPPPPPLLPDESVPPPVPLPPPSPGGGGGQGGWAVPPDGL